MKKGVASKLLLSGMTGLILLLFSFPFIWMVLSSFKTQVDIQAADRFFKFTPTLQNYSAVFTQYDFMKYIVNSFVVALGSTLFALVLGVSGAYGIARYKMQGIGLTILIARIVPGITFLIPWFVIFNKLEMIDTYAALILSHMLVGLPFIIWIMIPFFESLPLEIEEAGFIDGCSKIKVFLQLVIPISGPGIITSSLMCIIFSWNNFMFSIILSGEKTKTLPIAVFNFLSYAEVNWGGLMAAATIITLPVLVIALVAQKYVVNGMAAGAVKG
ncbi:carbohydrate ABC transporter permease [Paenibacillus hamazuiensis]|uniref:carbohydrate ABC transporter permease n=1 Tax=Paenibacillus hamazuiensis TaxID=2936508 RepID=UPI002010380D|nr:carbohydrate ABC transporter permease [Paenibacillus hamazuiensis]